LKRSTRGTYYILKTCHKHDCFCVGTTFLYSLNLYLLNAQYANVLGCFYLNLGVITWMLENKMRFPPIQSPHTILLLLHLLVSVQVCYLIFEQKENKNRYQASQSITTSSSALHSSQSIYTKAFLFLFTKNLPPSGLHNTIAFHLHKNTK